MKTLVAIFYIDSESQGSEISLAIAGWKKHFKGDCEILVVGDKPPVDIDGVRWMYVERLPEKEGEYRPALDICNKLMYVCQYCEEHMYNGFVWASDDFFAVNDFTRGDILIPKYYEDEMPSKGDRTQNAFWHTQIKTRRMCEKAGVGVVNWTTHLPMRFDATRLYWLIYRYNLVEHSAIVENLYFNIYPPDIKPEKLSRTDRWKFDVCYKPLDRSGLADAFKRKIWVCCSVHGWCPELEDELRKHYGLETNH